MAKSTNKLVQFLLVFYYWFEAIVLFFIPQRFRFKSVKGQTVLITGSGNGLGRELAIGFAKIGANVVVWDIDEEAIKQTVRLVSEVAPEVKVKGYVCDVSNREMVFKVSDQVKSQMGSVHILVNNAAVLDFKALLDESCDRISQILEINTLGNFWTIKTFLPDMIKNMQGHIVTIASIAGLLEVAGMSHYCASKHALVGMHRSLDLELWQTNLDCIKTTLVAPSFINTPMITGLVSKFGIKLYDPCEVAQIVISAVLSDTKFVAIPNAISHMVIWIRMLLPSKVFFSLIDLFGFYEMINGFVGRIDQDKKCK